MRNVEATIGTAETRANTEARIKNTDEKVNLTMMIKMTLVVVEGRRVPNDFIPMAVTLIHEVRERMNVRWHAWSRTSASDGVSVQGFTT